MRLSDALKANNGIGPGFHFLRHALSLAIILFHCRQVVYWAHGAQVLAASGITDAGSAAQAAANAIPPFTLAEIVRPAFHTMVGMFFALSGFLIAGSALRSGKVSIFFANRVLRIFPALSVETLLSAIILGPVVTALPLGAYFTDPQFFRYFGNIIGWVYFYLPGVFPGNPYPNVVNGQLWTLPSEFYCYIIMLLVMLSGAIKHRAVVAAIVIAVVALWLSLFLYDSQAFSPKNQNFYSPNYIVLMFWFGVLYFLYSDKISLKASLFIGSVVLYWVSIFFNILTPISGIFLSYAMIYIGFVKFPWWDKLLKADYSYGLFLYHFPILQAYMFFLSPALSGLPLLLQFAIIVLLGVPTTTVFAALSWRFIEKPALSLRKVFAPTPVFEHKQANDSRAA